MYDPGLLRVGGRLGLSDDLEDAGGAAAHLDRGEQLADDAVGEAPELDRRPGSPVS